MGLRRSGLDLQWRCCAARLDGTKVAGAHAALHIKSATVGWPGWLAERVFAVLGAAGRRRGARACSPGRSGRPGPCR